MKRKVTAMLMAGVMATGMLAGSAVPVSAEEPVTLRLIIKDVSPDDPTYQEWLSQFNADLVEAGIGAEIELVSLQSGTYSENLALLLNGGDIPDIIYFQGGDEDFALNQQILEDLTPYVENSTYIKGMIDQRAYMKTRLQNYPYLIYLSTLSTKVPVIRTDIFDKCEIKDKSEAKRS